ncbi:MAG: metallophosphoesterase [Proteobacteria bacterium]|nr:metallophosphoesterase [Pseudomonadota bacterium]
MRALFVTDLHGSTWKYERLFEAAKSFGANVVINGGDMLPQKSEPLRWSIEGGQVVLTLRSLILSDRWEEFWSYFLKRHFSEFQT